MRRLLAAALCLVAGTATAQTNNNPLATRLSLLAMPLLDARDAAYGMKCDNATDDAAALQAALTAAASKGSAVFISGNPSGAQATCLLSTNAAPPTGATLWSVPGTVTLKPTTGNVAAALLLSVANVSNIYVYGLTLDGGGQDFGTANNVNLLFNVDNVVFDKVRFQNTRGIALLASTTVTNSGVRNSVFKNIGNHWKTTALTADRQQAIAFCCGTVAGNHGNFSINNSFSDIGLDATSTTSQHDFLASGNTCQLYNGQITATWTNPQPIAFGACVYGMGNDHISITNNICEAASGNCYDTLNVADRVVSGNFARNAGDGGIGIYGTGNATVTGNTLLNNGQWSAASIANGGSGIELNNTAGVGGKVVVSGNVSTDNQAAISTTCTGTVAVGATSCTAASVVGMSLYDQIKIAGAGAAAADLSTTLTGISGSVITWRTATSTSTSGAAVTGIATQLYGIWAKAGSAFTDLKIGSNTLSGNVTGAMSPLLIPAIASGGCTTGSAQSLSAPNGTAAFSITLGGATCGSTLVLTMPAAVTGWVCDAHDITTPAGNAVDQTGGGSTTAVTLTNYSRTTGLAANFTGADVLAINCGAY